MKRRRLRRRERLPCALRLREYLRQFVAFLFSNLGVIGLVVGYIIAGAFIFQAIEGSSELERVQSMGRQRQLAVERLWHNATVPLNVFDEKLWKRNVTAELQKYQRVIVQAVRQGWDGSDDVDFYRQWSFPGSFLYSLTIITTIGYGNIAPRTDWGKVTTIFYAMIGMPLFLLYLTNLGDLLARSFKWFYVNLCLCRGCPGIAKRRAMRLRMQIQAQLGEQFADGLEEFHATWNERKRRKSAPEPGNNKSFCYGPHSDTLHTISERRGKSVPNYSGYNEISEIRNEIYGKIHRKKATEYSQDSRYKDCRTINYENIHEMNEYKTYKERSEDFDNKDNFRYKHYKNYNNNSDFVEAGVETYPYVYQNEERRKRCQHNEWAPSTSNNGNKVNDFELYATKVNRYEQENKRKRRNLYQPDESQNSFLERSKQISKDSDDSSFSNELCDPIDNYGRFKEYTCEDAVDSDQFTYITIDSENVTVPITICVFIMVGYIFFGAMMFGMWEDWDKVDGSYFCFISLTSIGFGDIVPGERIFAKATINESIKRIDTSFILCSIYLLFGMALVAMCFNLMQEQVMQYISAIKRVVRNVCRCNFR